MSDRYVTHPTQRERFLAYMTHQEVDRVPLMDMGMWDETFDRWHHEGLPKWVTSIRHLEDYLRLDRSFNLNWLPINQEVYPPFEERVLEETEEEQVISDANGVIFRQGYRFTFTMQLIEQGFKFFFSNFIAG